MLISAAATEIQVRETDNYQVLLQGQTKPGK